MKINFRKRRDTEHTFYSSKLLIKLFHLFFCIIRLLIGACRLLLSIPESRGECLDFAFKGPAENIVRSIAYPASIILRVASRTITNKALARDAKVHILQALHVRAAEMVETSCRFRFHPRNQRVAFKEVQSAWNALAVAEKIAAKRRHLCRHTMKRKPNSEMAFIEELRHRNVVSFRNKQRNSELMKQTFDGAGPLAEFAFHLHQFSRERQLVCGNTSRGTNRVTDHDKIRGDKNPTISQRLQFLAQARAFPCGLLLFHEQFDTLVICVVSIALNQSALLLDLATNLNELFV